MKCNFLQFSIAVFLLVATPTFSLAQTYPIGEISKYLLYSGSGSIANKPENYSFLLVGNVGSQSGSITGFATTSTYMTGTTAVGNASTLQAQTDAQSLMSNFLNIPTQVSQSGNLGSTNTAISPGIYYFNTANNISGTLSLDGQNDINSKFIFIYQNGLTIANNVAINLINSANAANVYWVIPVGVTTIGTGVNLQGNVISDAGNISFDKGGTLVGRLVSNSGNINVINITATSTQPVPLPVKFSTLTGLCDNNLMVIKFSTASEQNNKFFTIQQSVDAVNWVVKGTIAGAGNSSTTKNYAFTDSAASTSYNYYRIMQSDINGTHLYSAVLSVNACGNAKTVTVSTYPNPSKGIFAIGFEGDRNQVINTTVSDMNGKKVYQSSGLKSTIDLSNQPEGVYLLQVKTVSKIYSDKIIIQK